MTDTSPVPAVLTLARLRVAAGVLAFAVASVHLFHPTHGGRRFTTVVATDPGALATSPLPLAFVVSGFALVAGVLLVQLGLPERPVVAGGIGLMLVYIVGYFGWHLSGHGGVLPGRQPLYHGATPLDATWSHLTGDALAAAALASEVALLAVLVLLERRLPPEDDGAPVDERNP